MINLSFEGTPAGLMKYIGEEICEFCLGEGVVYQSVLYHGDNLAPGGMYDFEPRTCQCRIMEQDNEEE